jgi:hypothetical protein
LEVLAKLVVPGGTSADEETAGTTLVATPSTTRAPAATTARLLVMAVTFIFI